LPIMNLLGWKKSGTRIESRAMKSNEQADSFASEEAAAPRLCAEQAPCSRPLTLLPARWAPSSHRVPRIH